MKYFIDTEFHEWRYVGVNTIELITLGVVCEDGRELYLLSKKFEPKAAWDNEWLRVNVLTPIVLERNKKMEPVKVERWHLEEVMKKDGLDTYGIAQQLVNFVGTDPEPEFYGYYADYDWVAICFLFGRMLDLPKGWPKYCRDLKQMLDERYMHQANVYAGKSRLEAWLYDCKKHPQYPKQAEDKKHNALDDAKWNRALYGFIQKVDNNQLEESEPQIATAQPAESKGVID